MLRILRSGYTGLVAIGLVILGPTLVVLAFVVDFLGSLSSNGRATLFVTSLVVGAVVFVIGLALGVAVLVVRGRARRPA